MAQKDLYVVEGSVTEALPNTTFRVEIDDPEAPAELSGKTILCTLSGKMRMYRIRVIPGDKVKIEVTPYDLNKGRITFRTK